MVTLDDVERDAAACTRCPLAATRSTVVFGSGPATSSLMLVGEAPGREEDERGRPFVGRSGALLDRLLSEELGVTRDDVYVTNTVKCRPPGNRTPEPAEVEACRPWFEAQLALVDPAVVVTLGGSATKLVLGTREGITKVRGRAYEVGGRRVVPTLHPAAILHGGGATATAAVKADLALAGAEVEDAVAG